MAHMAHWEIAKAMTPGQAMMTLTHMSKYLEARVEECWQFKHLGNGDSYTWTYIDIDTNIPRPIDWAVDFNMFTLKNLGTHESCDIRKVIMDIVADFYKK